MERVPVMRLSFIVALPFDVGFAQDSTATLFDDEEPLAGWDDVQVRVRPGGPVLAFPDAPTGLRLATSFWFRRVKVRGARPFEATERAFGGLLRSGPRVLARARAWLLQVRSPTLRGIETRAVVQLTRLVPPPADGDELSGWFSDEFDIALSKLNEVLIAAATVSRDPAIGPVSIDELPPLALVLHGPVEAEEPERSLLLLNYGSQGEADPLDEQQMSHIFQLVGRQHGPGHPFFPVAEAMVEARRAAARGRRGHAVLELGTAFELMVATVVREVGPIRGHDAVKIQAILDAGLKNVVQDHLPRLLSIDIDLENVATGFGAWWQRGYSLRNRIVHQGHRPTSAETRLAREAAQAVVAEIAEALLADEATAWLGGMLVVRAVETS